MPPCPPSSSSPPGPSGTASWRADRSSPSRSSPPAPRVAFSPSLFCRPSAFAPEGLCVSDHSRAESSKRRCRAQTSGISHTSSSSPRTSSTPPLCWPTPPTSPSHRPARRLSLALSLVASLHPAAKRMEILNDFYHSSFGVSRLSERERERTRARERDGALRPFGLGYRGRP